MKILVALLASTAIACAALAQVDDEKWVLTAIVVYADANGELVEYNVPVQTFDNEAACLHLAKDPEYVAEAREWPAMSLECRAKH
jgi:hypothetical protein